MPCYLRGEHLKRNDSVDALRIIASIGVIALHVGEYSEFDPLFADIVRSLFRWCVPFFFMVTGYYLADESSPFPNVTLEKLRVPFLAFVTANVIFMPLLILQSGLSGVTLATLVRGSYFHLWYLTALLLALLSLHFCAAEKLRPAVIAFASVVLVGYIAINFHYARSGSRYDLVMLLREFSGIPFILLGGVLRSNRAAMQAAVRWAFPAGLVVLVAEVVGLRHLGWHPADVQLQISSLLISVGLLANAVRRPTLAPSWLGDAGRRDAFAIYLYHPIAVLIVASVVAADFTTSVDGQPGLPLWLGGALLTWAGLKALSFVWPTARSAMEGRWRYSDERGRTEARHVESGSP